MKLCMEEKEAAVTNKKDVQDRGTEMTDCPACNEEMMVSNEYLLLFICHSAKEYLLPANICC